MKRSRQLLDKRNKYIYSQLQKLTSIGIPVSKAVLQISEQLFISEKTIWNDLKKFSATMESTV